VEFIIIILFIIFSILYFLSMRSMSILEKERRADKDNILLRAYRNCYHAVLWIFLITITADAFFKVEPNYHLLFYLTFVSVMFISNFTVLFITRKFKSSKKTNQA
jgi:Na+/H+ antiporter NhaC